MCGLWVLRRERVLAKKRNERVLASRGDAGAVTPARSNEKIARPRASLRGRGRNCLLSVSRKFQVHAPGRLI